MLSRETVHRNLIKLAATENTLKSINCLINLYIVGWIIINSDVFYAERRSETGFNVVMSQIFCLHDW